MKCPCIHRVSEGIIGCDLDYDHRGPHKDGRVSWVTPSLKLLHPIQFNSQWGKMANPTCHEIPKCEIEYRYSSVSSRTCERGTNGCTVNHEEA